MLLHDESPTAVQAREDAFLVKTYNRTPFHPRDGKGSRLFDAEGRAYWDLLGGIAVNVLGHKHPKIVKALKDVVPTLLTIVRAGDAVITLGAGSIGTLPKTLIQALAQPARRSREGEGGPARRTSEGEG